MISFVDESPIIACCSGGNENSAVGLIRISGFQNIDLFQNYFDKDLTKIKPRFATLIKLKNKNKIIDSVILTFFPGPHSYTGENVIELGVHGNKINIEQCISLFVTEGLCRMAGAGEFTFRALKNKKLNLHEVEGLDLLLNAQSKLALDSGMSTLHGELNEIYQTLYVEYCNAKAAIELLIDFAEDVGEETAWSKLNESKEHIKRISTSLFKRCEYSDFSSLLSPQIVLFGAPNAGKSTLFNLLLGHDRSIVSPTPGTTRDYISEYLQWEDLKAKLVDTAGVRDAQEKIEGEGIRRSILLLNQSFFRVLVVNPNLPADNLITSALKGQSIDLLVITHADSTYWTDPADELISSLKYDNVLICNLLSAEKVISTHQNHFFEQQSDTGPIGPNVFIQKNLLSFFTNSRGKINSFSAKNLKDGPIGPREKGLFNFGPIGPKDDNSRPLGPIGPFKNLKSEANEIEIFALIKELVLYKYHVITRVNPIMIDRHCQVIKRIFNKSEYFQTVSNGTGDLAIIDMALVELGHEIEELVGIITPDKILDSIFENFCIGK